MSEIRRLGENQRYADVISNGGVAYWVEVAEDPTASVHGQIAQVLAQIDATLKTLGADRRRLLQVLIYLSDLSDAPILNQLWDAWIIPGEAPVRACVQAGLWSSYKVEMVITAAAEVAACR